MDEHPSLMGINTFSQQIVENVRVEASGQRIRPATPVRISLRSGDHYIERIVDVDHQSDPGLEREIIAQVIQSMVFRLRMKVDTPPAQWQWSFNRIEV
jgi:hypothetical protein